MPSPIKANPFEDLKDKRHSGRQRAQEEYTSRMARASYNNELPKGGSNEAVVKVVSHLKGASVGRAIDYIQQEESLNLEDENGRSLDAEESKKTFERWKADFELDTQEKQRQTRHATHVVLSVDCEHNDGNAHKVEQAVRETLRANLGDHGYRYMFTVHRDQDKPHAHVIINNYNRRLDGPKLRLNKPELFKMRQDLAVNLKTLGIEQRATMKLDREVSAQLLSDEKSLDKTVRNWLESKIKTASLDPVDLQHRREQLQEITRARQDIKQGQETEDSIKALNDLRSLAHALSIQDRYNNKKSAFNQLNELQSEQGPYSSLIKDIKGSRGAGEKEPTKKQLAFQARRMATEMIEGRVAIQRNAQLDNTIKQQLNQDINKRLASIEKHIPGGLQRLEFTVQQKIAPDDPLTAKIAKAVSSLERGSAQLANHSEDPGKNLDAKKLQREVSKLFMAEQDIKQSNLSGWRKEQLNQSLGESATRLSQVANIPVLRQQWERQQQTFKQLKNLDRQLDSLEQKQGKSADMQLGVIQQKITSMRTQKPEESYSRKDYVTVSKSLEKLQKKIDGLSPVSGRGKDLASIERSAAYLTRPGNDQTEQSKQRSAERIYLRMLQHQERGDQYRTPFERQVERQTLAKVEKSLGPLLSEKQKAKVVSQDMTIKKHTALNQDVAKTLNQAKEFTGRREIQQIISAIEKSQDRSGINDLPRAQKDIITANRDNVINDFLSKASPEVGQSVDRWQKLTKQIQGLEQFQRNAEKKHGKGSDGMKNAGFVIGQKAEQLKKGVDESGLPRRVVDKLNQRLSKVRSIAPRQKTQGRGRRLSLSKK